MGWAHNVCNVNRKTKKFTPVFAHSLHIIKALNSGCQYDVFTVVPSTDEKYIALNMGVFIKTITDKNGKSKNVYEYLRFVDSYKLMLMSLDKMAASLPSQVHFLGLSLCEIDRGAEEFAETEGSFNILILGRFQKTR